MAVDPLAPVLPLCSQIRTPGQELHPALTGLNGNGRIFWRHNNNML